jgi:phospholipid-binding lipoprotein MlaA
MHSPIRQFIYTTAIALLSAFALIAYDPAAAQSTDLPAAAKDVAAPADADLANPKSAQDPWENFNRNMHSFNKKADKYLVRPVAVAYDTVTPAPVQRGFSNFFANLKAPRALMNQLLQGHPVDAAQTFGRFVTNTTVGVGGFFDPASAVGLERRDEDFGRTLASWGWEDSRYLVLPLSGPGTVRDVVGGFVDGPLAPLGYVDNSAVVWGTKVLEAGNARTKFFPLEASLAESPDEYAFVRDMWMRRRLQKAPEGSQPRKD